MAERSLCRKAADDCEYTRRPKEEKKRKKNRVRPQFQAIFVYANISGFLRHISVASPAETWLSSKSLRNRTGIREEDSNSRRYVPVGNNNEERQ